MSYRRLIILALLGALPTISWAQFTTFIPPRTKAAEPAKTVVVARERARTDSVMRIKLTDMKAWVDSAAGSVAVPNTATDPAATPTPVPTPAATPTPVPTARVTDTATLSAAARDSALRVRQGARAPDTASDLPMLALIGAIALAIGTVMLAGTQLGRDRA
jgi:hypothetical protein